MLRHWIPRDREPRVAVQPDSGSGVETAGREVSPNIEGADIAPAAEDLSRVDRATVVRLRGSGARGRPNLYSRLVGLFRAGSTAALDELRVALHAGDMAAARAICHKLKSSAANVGAMAFSEDVRRLEQLCAGGDAAAAWSTYERLRSAHPALIAALAAFEQRETA